MSARGVDECRQRLLSGLIPAVPVPFTHAGTIDSTAQAQYAAWMAEQPIAGVAVWAHTGRGLHLSREQRLDVLKTWRGSLSQHHVIVAGVGAPATLDDRAAEEFTCTMAADAVDNGAHALMVHPPTRFRTRRNADELVLAHHRRLADLGRPLILFYLYEAAGGISYSPPLLRELLVLPQVVGIKLATLDSVMTFQDIAALMSEEFPSKLLITGEDRFLGYSLMCGAQAALIGMGAVCTALQHNLLRSWFGGETKDFLHLSRQVDLLSQRLFIPPMEGYIARVLAALVHSKVLPAGSAYDPWGPSLQPDERDQIRATLRAIEADAVAAP